LELKRVGLIAKLENKLAVQEAVKLAKFINSLDVKVVYEKNLARHARLGEGVSMESLIAALSWLQDNGWLSCSRIGRNANEAEGYQVEWGALEFQRNNEFLRCRICGRNVPDERAGVLCPRPGCEGTLAPWPGPLAEGNLNALL